MTEIAERPCATSDCGGVLGATDRFCAKCGADVEAAAETAKQWATKGLDSPRRKVKIGGATAATGALVAWFSSIQLQTGSVIETVSSGGPDAGAWGGYAVLFVIGALIAAFGVVVLAWGALHGGFRVASGERVGAGVKAGIDRAKPIAGAAKVQASATAAAAKEQASATALAAKAQASERLRRDVAPRVSKAREDLAPKVSKAREDFAPKVAKAREDLAPKVAKARDDLAPRVAQGKASMAKLAARVQSKRDGSTPGG